MAFEAVGIESLLAVSAFVAVVAFFYSNLGLGGGQLYVPIMVLFFVDLDMKEIVPLSLCFAFVTMFASAYNHRRKGLVDVRLGANLAAGGLVGAFFGVMFTSTVDGYIIKIAFAALMLIVATKMMHDMHRGSKEPSDATISVGTKRKLMGLGVSVLTGFLVGSFGIGGGVVSVPLIIYVFRVETRRAIGTSAMVGAVLTPAAFAGYAFQEGVAIHYDIALALTPLVLLFGLIGSAWGLQKLKTRLVRTIFTGGLYLAASGMIYSLMSRR